MPTVAVVEYLSAVKRSALLLRPKWPIILDPGDNRSGAMVG